MQSLEFDDGVTRGTLYAMQLHDKPRSKIAYQPIAWDRIIELDYKPFFVRALISFSLSRQSSILTRGTVVTTHKV